VDPSGLSKLGEVIDAARGAGKAKDKKDQIEDGIGRTKKIKECYKRAARACPGHYVDQPKVCKDDRMKAEEKCKQADVMDVFKGAVTALGGIPGAVVEAAGGYKTPSSESNTTKQKGKESASGASGWITVSDENGTIIDSAAFGCDAPTNDDSGMFTVSISANKN